ncbi:agc pkc protein kinase [Lichtheimia corymbifera JMRC:FSU:9682]|uniref:Agc pkc protein kinase n=1 Tax=Lichtheimia corymbifera JMRC:FSU:9682 TaxID=1263082 RepID=A0A068RSM1_9FUNG|nr:agc pkc protein kinase [Lichtheimia corymbifera JMRC:FSU:9682]
MHIKRFIPWNDSSLCTLQFLCPVHNNKETQETMNHESKICELQKKLDDNKKVRDRAIHLRSLLTDANTISQCETQIKESQKYIDYFSEELHKLQTRSLRTSTHGSSDDSTTGANDASDSPSGENKTNSPLQSPAASSLTTPPRSSSIPTTAPATGATGAKKFTNLDLLTSAVPYNKPKVSLKLHELEYKLDVEKKVLTGIKTMADVIEKSASSGDRRQRDEVQGQLYESVEKRNLLDRALRKYKGLYIGEGDEDDYELETPLSARVPPGLRRPVTGKLQLQIIEARELAHAPTRMIRMPETVVYVKIDGNVVYRSRPTRNDKWLEECEIHVNKASEVEIAIYDQAVERNLPIGILWLKITDIAEGLRKRKIQQEGGQGWVSAEVAQQRSQDTLGSADPHSPVPQQPVAVQSTQEGIQAWFDVEPLGELALRLNFVREAANRRPLDKLGRVGAVRQRPGEVHEMNGHQFVEKKFYNVMKCSLCGEFLVNSGYQCEDCEYTCHKKCYQKVVTKCISRSQSETDADEDKLNHRIPHRFEPITNIGANWCCHCGYMLPLGSRGAKKCSECDITCHTKCQHFVPDFCGLSMEMANQMLAEIKAAKRKTLETGPSTSSASKPTPPRPDDQGSLPELSTGGSPSTPTESISTQLSQLSLQQQQQQTSPQQQPQPPMHQQMPPQHVQQPRPPVQQQQPGMSPGRMNMPQPPPPHMVPVPGPGQPYQPYPADPRYQQPPPQQQPYPPSNVRPVMQQQPPSPYAPIPNPAMMGRPPYNQPMQQQPYPPSMDMAPRPPPKQAVGKAVGLDDFNFLAVLGHACRGKAR